MAEWRIEMSGKRSKIWRKSGPKKRGPRAPGRGVLHFSARGYRNPVHILGFFAFFSKKGQT